MVAAGASNSPPEAASGPRSLLRDWDGIDVGDTVLATTGEAEGWYECIVIRTVRDDLFELRWLGCAEPTSFVVVVRLAWVRLADADVQSGCVRTERQYAKGSQSWRAFTSARSSRRFPLTQSPASQPLPRGSLESGRSSSHRSHLQPVR